MTKRIVEQDIEDAALDILHNDLCYDYIYDPSIAPYREMAIHQINKRWQQN